MVTDLLHIVFDFSQPTAATSWSAIDDRVMGGQSSSRLRQDPAGHAVFEGEIRLEGNGGFASVRSRPAALGCTAVDCLLLEVSGARRDYKVSLFCHDAIDGIAHQARFAPPGPGWRTVLIPLDAFVPTLRGRAMPGAPPVDPAAVRQVGLVTADRRAGMFSLAIRQIAWTQWPRP